MSAPVHILFIDNFDSFSFNLVSEFEKMGAQVQVWRNDIPVEKALTLALNLPTPGLVVLSPGPSSPAEAGCTVELIRRLAGRVPIFGVCLGHQAIVEALGGKVDSVGEIVHGKAAQVTHVNEGIFANFPSPFWAARYHSLAASRVPAELRVTAQCKKIVMAVQHTTLPLLGVQFHPESILTPQGGELLRRVLDWAANAHISLSQSQSKLSHPASEGDEP